MASPAARGLFAKAISQSGLGREASESLDDARADGQRLVAGLGLADPDADELRDLPADQVMGLPLDLLQGDVPIVDGTVLPAPVADVFEAGDEAPVPFLVGTTDLEVPDLLVQQTGRDPDELAAQIVGDNEAAAVAAYGGRTAFDSHLISDVLFTEPARHLARAARGRRPDVLLPVLDRQPGPEAGPRRGAARLRDPLRLRRQQRPALPGRGRRGARGHDQRLLGGVRDRRAGRPTTARRPWPAYDRRRRLMELTDVRAAGGPGSVDGPARRRRGGLRRGAGSATRIRA